MPKKPSSEVVAEQGIVKRTYEDGAVRYVSRFRDPRGKQRSRSFRRLTDARKHRRETLVALDRGEWSDPKRQERKVEEDPTFAEWAEQWLATKRGRKQKTLAGYRWHLDARVLPAFGDRRLSEMRRADVEAWVASFVERGLSRSSIRQSVQVLSAALKAAVRDDIITRNVAAEIELPRREKTERRFLTEKDVARLAYAIGPAYRSLVLVLAYGGLRFGEAVALRRGRCDLLRKRLLISESATDIGGRLDWGDTKTSRERTVSLPQFVVEELAAHLTSRPADPEALVWTAPQGGPLRYGNFIKRVWKQAVEAAQLGRLTPHELRHTAASLLIAEGASPKSVQAQLGHASITVTLDIYGQLWPEHLDDVMARFDERHRGREAG